MPLAEHDGTGFVNSICPQVSIHVPLAEHDLLDFTFLVLWSVSIHVPLAEHDRSQSAMRSMLKVSIHVPLAEHDQRLCTIASIAWSFNSRAPRGARPCPGIFCGISRQFQFTCPSRSTTTGSSEEPQEPEVSIHVPLAEHDTPASINATAVSCFNSRAPRGARRTTGSSRTPTRGVSIHVPLAEHDMIVG